MKTLVFLSFLTTFAVYADRIRAPEHDVQNPISLTVHWVESARELREVHETVCGYVDCRPLESGRLTGYAVLMQHDTGQWTCFIYAFRPHSWKDSTRMETLGHELMHCLGYDH